MVRIKYKIYTLSARAVLSYAKERNDGIYSILLNSTATEKCRVYSALHEQEDNALFFQTMCVLHGNDFQMPSEQNPITDLSDIIFYMDFAESLTGTRNRNGMLTGRKKRNLCSVPKE